MFFFNFILCLKCLNQFTSYVDIKMIKCKCRELRDVVELTQRDNLKLGSKC